MSATSVPTVVPTTLLKRKPKKNTDSVSPAAKVLKSVDTMTSDSHKQMSESTEFASPTAPKAFLPETTTERAERYHQNDLTFLNSLQPEVLQQRFLEKNVHRIADVSVGTIITVRGHRIETTGKFGEYPVIKCDFEDQENVELALPARYKNKLEGRNLPFYMLYAGTSDYQGKTLQRVEFVNMKFLHSTASDR